jgi:hypothetical protein
MVRQIARIAPYRPTKQQQQLSFNFRKFSIIFLFFKLLNSNNSIVHNRCNTTAQHPASHHPQQQQNQLRLLPHIVQRNLVFYLKGFGIN